MFHISIIIPTLNEAEGIEKLLSHLHNVKSSKITSEIIVVDGGSSDETKTLVKKHPSLSCLIEGEKGRAKQMNNGAEKAKGEVLYFLHADTFPPKGFDVAILKGVSKKTQAGSFRMLFDKNSVFFNFWSWFSRFKWNVASGGDQSLFITKTLFNKVGGFGERWIIMEDIEIIIRIKQATNYIKLPQKVITSTRKYDRTGAVKLQVVFSIMHIKKMLGATPITLFSYYNKKVGI